MKKIILSAFALFFTAYSISQDCTSNNDSTYSYMAMNNGFIEEASTFVRPGEYMTVTNILANTYTFTANHTETMTEQNDYITISDTSNNILAQGVSPLSHTFGAGSTIRIHISLNSNCDTSTINVSVYLLNETVAPTTCQMPENPTVSYRSHNRIDFSWDPPNIGDTPVSYDWEAVPGGNVQGVGVVDSGNVVTPGASATGLTPGATYTFYIRSKCGVNGDSDWFMTPFPLSTNTGPPPSNDICSGATFIVEETGKDINSATAINGTLLNTAQTDVDPENCDSGNVDNARDDVWYSFIAQTNDINIALEPMFDGVLTLLSDCDELAILDCSDLGTSTTNELISYNSLVIGQTYYFRVWSQGFAASNPNFSVKLWSPTSVTDSDNDGYSDEVDCVDDNDSIYPGAPEIADNGIDEDCDGSDLKTWYLDADEDLFGDDNNSTLANTQPMGYVADNTDCNDGNPAINPGKTEICNGIDDDCDLDIDDDDSSIDSSSQSIWYEDADSDGFGDPNSSLLACSQPAGYVSDSSDNCPNDVNKIEPGDCGCGTPDTDTDSDGTPDCNDNCPNDANKIEPGDCGCGTLDTDTDSDGTPDCNDNCPNDANKMEPGDCGCGTPDTDTDSDGTPDCNDNCPNDANKIEPGDCGCGTPETDTDSDGTPDCNDNCPNDANKIELGDCGCGTPETDTDSDGIPDCNDNCPSEPNPGQEDSDGNGVGDACDTLSVEELSTQNINIIPNPFDNNFTIEMPNTIKNQIINIELFDLNGRSILKLHERVTHNFININGIQNLQQGIYLIKIKVKSKDSVVLKRIIKL